MSMYASVNKQPFFYKVFIFLIAIWILLSFFNILYNIGKTYQEIKEWAFLSDSEKRHKIFGDLHDFFLLVDSKTEENSRIIILSSDIKTHYLSIYYLYPRKTLDTSDIQQVQQITSSMNYSYLASYNSFLTISGYEQIASYSSKMTSNYGVLYKRK